MSPTRSTLSHPGRVELKEHQIKFLITFFVKTICNRKFPSHAYTHGFKIEPLPDMPILDFPNSAAKKYDAKDMDKKGYNYLIE